MKRVRFVVLALLWACGGLSARLAWASDPAEQPPVTAPKAASRIEVGVEERIRTENWNNIIDHDEGKPDARRQWRARTRVWAKVPAGARVSFFVGLNDESKTQSEPDLPLALDEIIFDQLYVDVQATSRLSARVGRQNIMKGDGFILFDGTSGDGSRSMYMNGVDVTYAVAPKAKLEAIVVSNPARDQYLPVLHDREKALSEWRERLGGFYYTDTRLRGTDLQAYYLFKDERGDRRPTTNPQYQPPRSTHTVGARLARQLGTGWTLTGELAGQFGTQAGSTPVRASGGYATLRRTFDHPWKPTLLAGYTGMSGDDPKTAANERWDPLMSRWPKWSELYIYSLVPEVGVAYWTNTSMWQAEAAAAPTRRLTIRGTYYHLDAFHPFRGSPAIFAAGTTRGDLFETRCDFTLHPSLKGHVLYERFLPGKFYKGTAPGYFFRAELIYSLQKKVGA